MRTSLRRAITVIAMMIAVLPAAPALADAPAPFGVLANEAAGSPGAAPATLVVGDSLVFGMSQAMADLLTNSSGRTTWVAASGGASIPNFINTGWLDAPLWGGPKLATIESYNRFLGARITVIALATNDVRIMTGYPALYGRSEHAAALATAIRQARTSSTCVFLVNAANHSGPASTDAVTAVDENINATATGRTFRIDWKTYSAGHEDWFTAAGNPHHSAVGRLMYADLIHRDVQNRVATGQC